MRQWISWKKPQSNWIIKFFQAIEKEREKWEEKARRLSEEIDQMNRELHQIKKNLGNTKTKTTEKEWKEDTIENLKKMDWNQNERIGGQNHQHENTNNKTQKGNKQHKLKGKHKQGGDKTTRPKHKGKKPSRRTHTMADSKKQKENGQKEIGTRNRKNQRAGTGKQTKYRTRTTGARKESDINKKCKENKGGTVQEDRLSQPPVGNQRRRNPEKTHTESQNHRG